jgi:DNA-binding NarL/FixJ family response regulator
MAIRVLLVDDQVLFREGLETLLSVHKDIQVVGNASNGQEAVEVAAQVRPDVVLMDVRMPVLDGVRATSLLQDALPQCRVIVLTTFDDDEYIFDALRAGAVGYLLKDVASAQLVEAIRAVARGESILEPLQKLSPSSPGFRAWFHPCKWSSWSSRYLSANWKYFH